VQLGRYDGSEWAMAALPSGLVVTGGANGRDPAAPGVGTTGALAEPPAESSSHADSTTKERHCCRSLGMTFEDLRPTRPSPL
jgi:hypothetical protein